MSGRAEAMGEEEPVREGDSDVSTGSSAAGHRKRKPDEPERPPLRVLPTRPGRGAQADEAAPVSKHKRPRAASSEEEGGAGGGSLMNGGRRNGTASNGGRSGLGRGGPRKQRQRSGEAGGRAVERTVTAEKGKDEEEEEEAEDAMEVVEEEGGEAEEEGEEEEGGKAARKGGARGKARRGKEDEEGQQDEGGGGEKRKKRGGKQEEEGEGDVMVVEKDGGGKQQEEDDDDDEVVVVAEKRNEENIPRSLGLIDHKASKCFKYPDKVTIKAPDVLVQHFEWTHQKWFMVGAFNAKGGRIRGTTLHQKKVRYRISYAADEKKRPQVLYDEQGECGKGSSAFFRPPQFKIPGLYILHFSLEDDHFKDVAPFEQTITVETKAPVDTTPASPPPLDDAVSAKPLLVPEEGAAAAKKKDVEAKAAGGQEGVGGRPKRAEAAGREEGAESRGRKGGKKIVIDEDEEEDDEEAEEEGGKGRKGLTVKTDVARGVKGGREEEHVQSEDEEGEEEDGGAAGPSSSGGGGGGGGPVAFEDVVQPGAGFSLKLPGALQKQLVDEWFNVTRKRRLVPLPRKPSAVEIMRQFEREQAGWSPRRGGKAPTKETERLCVLFDGCLGTMLLYRFEREQYVQQVEKAKERRQRPHQVWGAEHLLRFLITLPRLLTPPAAAEERGGKRGRKKKGGGGGGRGGGGKKEKKAAAAGPSAEESAAELKQTGAFVQGLILHLEANHRTLFTTTEEAGEGYGLDVPRVHRQQH